VFVFHFVFVSWGGFILVFGGSRVGCRGLVGLGKEGGVQLTIFRALISATCESFVASDGVWGVGGSSWWSESVMFYWLWFVSMWLSQRLWLSMDVVSLNIELFFWFWHPNITADSNKRCTTIAERNEAGIQPLATGL